MIFKALGHGFQFATYDIFPGDAHVERDLAQTFETGQTVCRLADLADPTHKDPQGVRRWLAQKNCCVQ